MPKKERPKCRGCKRVPKLSGFSAKISRVYFALSTLSTTPELGTIKLDFDLVENLFDLIGIDSEEREFSRVLITAMVLESTDIRLSERKKDLEARESKREAERLRRKTRR